MFDKKVLCLGTNNENTDLQTTELANQNSTVNHGLINNVDNVPREFGFYHTTVIDLTEGAIYQLSKYFDSIILLDQPVDQWSNWKLLLISYKLVKSLESQGKTTIYRDNKNVQSFLFFEDHIKDNQSFCIHPWITFYEKDGHLKLCPRSTKSIEKTKNVVWQTNANYQTIRKKMLAGERLPDYCKVCYDYENRGIESYRQYETREWLAKLDIKDLKDLDNITNPYFYDLKLDNKCNIMCRSCDPISSHLIERESKEYNIVYPFFKKHKFTNYRQVDISSLGKYSRVYFMGGEPTISPEVYAFMRDCIEQNKTNFEFCIGTNGVKFSDTFIELADHFSNMHFSFSLDGYKQINDYWRHGSKWDDIIKNMHLVKTRGHTISSNTVPGIYNVTNLHLLFEFLDQEFPGISMYLQLNYFESQSAFNHPNSKMVVESMQRCMKTDLYYADGKSTRSGIDAIYQYYSNNPACNLENLKKFFDHNDRLDEIRNIRLSDYIPELEACRSLLN